MQESKARRDVVITGQMLLKEGLVARTWGNVSARVDRTHFVITPSGLSYLETRDDDLALYDMTEGTYTGTRKPSSEKGIHASAYEVFSEVGFVIHTHQKYASALGVGGINNLDITLEERIQLGGIAIAPYGLPGTKTLKKHVKDVFLTGAQTVLLQHHGAVILGKDMEQALERVKLLEEICKRNYKGMAHKLKVDPNAQEFYQTIRNVYPDAKLVQSNAVIACANEKKPIIAQLDDMAQMIGRTVVVASKKKATLALQRYDAVLIPYVGGIVRGEDEEDTEALAILLDKAAICARHTRAVNVQGRLGKLDCVLMRFVYQHKYSKQKKG